MEKTDVSRAPKRRQRMQQIRRDRIDCATPTPPPATDDQVRVVFAEEEDPAVLEQLYDLLLQLLRDPKAK